MKTLNATPRDGGVSNTAEVVVDRSGVYEDEVWLAVNDQYVHLPVADLLAALEAEGFDLTPPEPETVWIEGNDVSALGVGARIEGYLTTWTKTGPNQWTAETGWTWREGDDAFGNTRVPTYYWRVLDEGAPVEPEPQVGDTVTHESIPHSKGVLLKRYDTRRSGGDCLVVWYEKEVRGPQRTFYDRLRLVRRAEED